MTTQEAFSEVVEQQVRTLLKTRRMAYLNGIPLDIFDKGVTKAIEELWPEYKDKSENELIQDTWERFLGE